MKQILCFGDSNTYGLVPGTTERYEWGTRWTSILENRVKNKGYRVIEEGLCGRTTVFEDLRRKGRRGTDLLPVLLESHSTVEIVVLMLGTNDCKAAYGATAERIGEGVEELLDQICSIAPEAQILLISPIALGDKVWEEGYDTEFNPDSVSVSKKLPRIYRQIAEKRGIEFLAASDYAAPGRADREHLDKEGHRKLADAVSEKIEGMIVQSAVLGSIEVSYYQGAAS